MNKNIFIKNAIFFIKKLADIKKGCIFAPVINNKQALVL